MVYDILRIKFRKEIIETKYYEWLLTTKQKNKEGQVQKTVSRILKQRLKCSQWSICVNCCVEKCANYTGRELKCNTKIISVLCFEAQGGLFSRTSSCHCPDPGLILLFGAQMLQQVRLSLTFIRRHTHVVYYKRIFTSEVNSFSKV